MPNWVRNQIIFKTKEDLNKALELCGIDISLPEKEPKMMDFGVLVPMPKNTRSSIRLLQLDALSSVAYKSRLE